MEIKKLQKGSTSHFKTAFISISFIHKDLIIRTCNSITAVIQTSCCIYLSGFLQGCLVELTCIHWDPEKILALFLNLRKPWTFNIIRSQPSSYPVYLLLTAIVPAFVPKIASQILIVAEKKASPIAPVRKLNFKTADGLREICRYDFCCCCFLFVKVSSRGLPIRFLLLFFVC